MDAPAELARFLDVIEHDIVPLTRRGVVAGNKLFGAAILRKDDLSLIVAETNNELENPLWHGEVHAIKRFFELPADARPAPGECLLLATHEPCSLCLSAITWAGFDAFAYLFSHRDSADRFAIPHDIRILTEVYAVPDPDRETPAPGRDLYNRRNAFFESRDLAAEIESAAAGDGEAATGNGEAATGNGEAATGNGEAAALAARVARLHDVYAELSATYQSSKDGAPMRFS